eukprot:CAMPEP_0170370030 /NCGR_PEP_ID=MMETSP0117_2-20130122/8296_1 /TAXON_ID=400756 /ORGANISM="Durinskia baltica, Strain CSIRO CS-38" /LENGTH=308 /DNA_ID=CAMNT_0010624783 /DNA_START=52 /DNA_END=978 /DNA_ORIENTATION=-
MSISINSPVIFEFMNVFHPDSVVENFFMSVINDLTSRPHFIEEDMRRHRKDLNKILKDYRDVEKGKGGLAFKSAQEVSTKARTDLSGCYVLLTFKQMLQDNSSELSVERFQERYPRFATAEDLPALLAYRNYMVAALKVMPAKNNKALLMSICARLSEGAGVTYVTGSGQSAATTRRVSIYECEGKVTPEPSRKNKRSTDEESDSSSSKRSRSYDSSSVSVCSGLTDHSREFDFDDFDMDDSFGIDENLLELERDYCSMLFVSTSNEVDRLSSSCSNLGVMEDFSDEELSVFHCSGSYDVLDFAKLER